MTNRKKGEIKIYWNDAVQYKHEPNTAFPQLTKMLTYGKLVEEKKDYLVIANPLTEKYDEELREFIPKPYITGRMLKEATFFYIPKGMIIKIAQ